jgi:hypothetical protein
VSVRDAAERRDALADRVGGTAPRMDQLVELQVHRAEARTDDIPVGVLADQSELVERCEDALELGPDRLAIDAVLRGVPAGHAATWFPDELPAGDTWLFRLTKVAGALVMNLGPTTVSVGRATV